MIKNSRMLKISSIILIIINLTTLALSKTNVSYPGVTESTLRDKIIPLKTVVAGNGFEDMQPLKEILKDKKVVAMGEATHGTKEFFQMKHRMFEFLVEEMGFRVFAIEGYFGEAQIINDYVLYGKGSAINGLQKLRFWTWYTKEVLDMIEWMRNYNLNPEHKRKVKFYGIDMQYPMYDEKMIDEYLNKVDEPLVSRVDVLFDGINKYVNDNFFDDKYKIKDFINKRNELNNIINIFSTNKDKYISKTSLTEYQLVYQDLINIYQFANYDKITRDESMADNVKWILDYEKQFGNDKIMVWAHNGHVATDGGNMGSKLRDIYGDKFYTIGFEFYDGSFQGRTEESLSSIQCMKPNEGSFSDILNRANQPLYFMDFKNASTNQCIEEWLSKFQECHMFGAETFNKDTPTPSYGYVTPISAYDGIIFVKHSTPAEENEW